MPPPPDRLAALVAGPGWAAMRYGDLSVVDTPAEVATHVARLEASKHPRWAWWAADEAAPFLLGAGVRPARSWDVAEVHRLLTGCWSAGPGAAWAEAHGLAPRAPAGPGATLFDLATVERADGPAEDQASPSDGGPAGGGVAVPRPAGDATPWGADGYLLPEAEAGRWQDRPARRLAWADALLEVVARQDQALRRLGGPALDTARSESAAALLCVELARDGLPLHRPTLEALLTGMIGPRPRDAGEAAALRRVRDEAVLRHTPGRESTDLRSPEQVKALLAAVGIVVPDTRKHRLEPYRGTHPVVAALLEWRSRERIATTYGWAWLDAHVGADDRLRGAWTACDGGAGRMTAQHGLHNLPAPLRPAVQAGPGHLFVRADLGQIEPRVLAAVSGDPAFAQASREDDLYAPVAAALGLSRPEAKVAVLAAMYGQTSGPAAGALARLTRAYPVAVAYLDRAYAAGQAGRAVRTYGGRLLIPPPLPAGHPHPDRLAAARGRYLRNAVIQGAAAELFKAWAATARQSLRPLGGRIVLCVHDEVLVHVPQDRAAEAAALLDRALSEASARWTGGGAVRFVSDTCVVRTWADAKDGGRDAGGSDGRPAELR